MMMMIMNNVQFGLKFLVYNVLFVGGSFSVSLWGLVTFFLNLILVLILLLTVSHYYLNVLT